MFYHCTLFTLDHVLSLYIVYSCSCFIFVHCFLLFVFVIFAHLCHFLYVFVYINLSFVVGQTTIIKSTLSNFDKSGRAKANFVAGQTTISLVLVALVHGVVPIGIVLIALQYTSTGACMLSSKISSKK